MRSPRRFELRHPEILDPDLLAQQSDFLSEAIALGLEPHPLVAAVHRPTATIRQGKLSQGQDVQDPRFDPGIPILGEWNLRESLPSRHFELPGTVVRLVLGRLA